MFSGIVRSSVTVYNLHRYMTSFDANVTKMKSTNLPYSFTLKKYMWRGLDCMKIRHYFTIGWIGIAFACAGCRKSDEINFPNYSHFKNLKTSDYVSLGQYRGLTITKETIPVSELEVDKKVEAVLYDAGYYVESKDSEVLTGTKVKISTTGFIEGKKVEGFTSNGYELIFGTEEYIMDGFAKNLEGALKGDVLTFDLKIPSTFREKAFVGKTVSFTVSIDKVETYYVPTLTDEFVREISDLNTVEEYRESFIPVIREEKFANITRDKKLGVWRIISDSSIVLSYPEGSLEAKGQQIRKQLEMYAMAHGISLETYVKKYFGVTFDEYVELSVKQDLLLDAIGRAENIALSQRDYEDSLKTYAKNFGYDDINSMVDRIGERKVKEALLWDKVMNYVANQAKIE